MQTAALAESSARGTLFARWHARGLGFGLAQLELARLLRIAALDERPSTFTITSTSGTVTGSKRLAGDTSTVSCTSLVTPLLSQSPISPPPIPRRSTARSGVRAPRR